MNHLINDQQQWEERELSLWKYRRKHIDEIREVVDEYISQYNREFEEQSQKEESEIESLKKTIEEENDEKKKKPLKYRLNAKIYKYDYNKSKKEAELNFFNKFINNHIKTLKLNAKKPLKLSDRRSSIDNPVYIKKVAKRCPKCKIPIDKNGGCNHMTCANCNHEFCWVCLRDWSSHEDNYYNCPMNSQINDDQINTTKNNNNNNNENRNQNQNDQDTKSKESDEIEFEFKAKKSDEHEDEDEIPLPNSDMYYQIYQEETDFYGSSAIIDRMPIQIRIQEQPRPQQPEQPEPEEEEDEEEEDDDDDDDEVVPEDHEFRLPPINLSTHSDFQRWELFNNNYKVHMNNDSNRYNSRSRVLYRLPNPNSVKLFNRVHSVLGRSYQLLFFLDPSDIEYNVFEYHVNNLEEFCNNFSSSPWRGDNEQFIKGGEGFIRVVLSNAHDLNFMNRK